MDKHLFRKWFGLARMYWRDAQGSSLDYISQRRCYQAAANRLDVPQALAMALFDRGLNEQLQANARLYALNEILDIRRCA